MTDKEETGQWTALDGRMVDVRELVRIAEEMTSPAFDGTGRESRLDRLTAFMDHLDADHDEADHEVQEQLREWQRRLRLAIGDAA